VKITILAVDGLDYEEAEKYPWLSVMLEDHKPLEVPLTPYSNVPMTVPVWASFLTGKPPTKSFQYNGTWGISVIDHFYWKLPSMFRPYAHKVLRKVLMLRVNTNLCISGTWLHELGFTIVDFPHINWYGYMTTEHRLGRQYLTTNSGLNDIHNWLLCDFRYKQRFVFSLNNVAVYYRHIDALGHLLPQSELENWYVKFGELVKEVSSRKDVLIVSDHGTVDGKHTRNGYAAASFSLDGVENIMDFARVLPGRISNHD
jgi:hypothetical protein